LARADTTAFASPQSSSSAKMGKREPAQVRPEKLLRPADQQRGDTGNQREQQTAQ
jgi:hypothetical protein